MTREDINDWFLEAQKIPRHSLWVWKLDTFQLTEFFSRVVEEAQKQKKVAVSKAIAKERKARAKCGECGKSSTDGSALYCVSCCEQSMVKAAVAAEREACAQLCYSRGPFDGTVSVEVELARAIRARGEA
jgi:hypothetical protein